MGNGSPDVVLYDLNGNALAVQNGSAIPASTPALLFAGSDGTNSRYITIDTSGRTVVVGAGVAGTPAGGVVSIQGVASGTVVPVSGTVTANAGTGNFTVVQATAANLNATITGTVTANIGTTNGLALDTSVNGILVSQGSTTSGEKGPLIQGAVTTASPTYITAQTSPLSLTTAGALRIDGSAVTQPVSGTVTSNQGTANSLANAWSTKITDATNGPAAVKAASTAAVATDPALVVAISPNNSLTIATTDTTGTGTLNALNATASVALAGHSSIGMQLVAGTLVGTIVPEISTDGGTSWAPTFFDDPATSNKVASIVFGASNTATTRTIVGCGGASNARVRVSAFTSGTATCNMRTTLVSDPTELFGGAAGSALPPVVSQVGGSVTTSAPAYSNATLNALSLNTSGDLRTISKVTDGTNTATVKAASTAAVAADTALVVAISPNNTITASSTGSYGTNNQTITITLASLASTGQRQSTAIDNTSNKFRDTLVQLTLKTGASGVASTGIVNVYAYGTVDGGTTYGDGATGTDGAITLTSPPNLKLIGTINTVANATTYKSNPLSVSAAFNGRLPDHWGIVVENKSSAIFDATAGNFKAAYQGVN